MQQLKWADILPANGVMGILGKRRQGKTALAYHVAELRHQLANGGRIIDDEDLLRLHRGLL